MQDLKSNYKDFQIRKPIIKPKVIRQANHYEDTKQELKKKNLYSLQKNTKNASIFKQCQQKQTKEIFLTQQFIKSSKIYKILEQQINNMTIRHNEQMQKLTELQKNKIKQAEKSHKENHTTKIEIWQLKNQIMQLQNQINYEEQQYQYFIGNNYQENQQQKQDNRQQEEGELQYQQEEMFLNNQNIQNPERYEIEASSQLLEYNKNEQQQGEYDQNLRQ